MMGAWRRTKPVRELVGRLGGTLCVAGALISCTSSPGSVFFVSEDCRGGLLDLANFPETTPTTPALATANNLALDGDTLYLTYDFASTSSGVSPSGGIVAVPVSGGSFLVVGAAENTSEWGGTGSFWVTGGQIYLQTDTRIVSLPAAAATPSALSTVSSEVSVAYVHDAEFGYSAGPAGGHATVTKTPIAGGAPTILVDEQLPNLALGGMADAGDAVLLQLQWNADPTSTAVWRIPKDGTARSDVRPDVQWADSSFPHWLAWDGKNILGPVANPTYGLVQARVATAGSSAPEALKFWGAVATRRGDEILSLQTLETRSPQGTTYRLLVASSKGAPEGSVVACGPETDSLYKAVPGGIAADDNGIYVSYRSSDATVIARVAQ